MRILLTRALEDSEDTAARLRERGHQALLAPLLRLRLCQGPQPDFTGVHAILATSANGIRALLDRTERRDFSIFAVGPATAALARRSGFADVRDADGDALDLAAAIPRWAVPGGLLLHVCGQDAGDRLGQALGARGFGVRRAPLYRMEAAEELPPEAVAGLRENSVDGALFFSARSAAIFAALAAGLPTERLSAFCLSAAAAQALAPRRFAHIAVASRPNQSALLALLG